MKIKGYNEFMINESMGDITPPEWIKMMRDTGREEEARNTERLFNLPSKNDVSTFEGIPQKDMHKYEITCRDPDGTLKDMIEHIGKLGNTGHSFSIVVDPDVTKEEGKRTFEWDGDGSDYIHEVKVIQEPVK